MSLNVVLSSAGCAFLCLSDDFIEAVFSIFFSSFFSINVTQKKKEKKSTVSYLFLNVLISFICSNFPTSGTSLTTP